MSCIGRKGISPLVAAVFLIGITMATATLLTAWVTDFTEQQTQAASNESDELIRCSQGVLHVLDVRGGPGQANITVANAGHIRFTNITVIFISSGNVITEATTYIDEPLTPGDVTSRQLSWPTTQAPDDVRLVSDRCPTVTAQEDVQ